MTAACEHQAAEHAATRRLTRATWALVAATVALIAATVLLASATYAEKRHAETAATQGVNTGK